MIVFDDIGGVALGLPCRPADKHHRDISPSLFLVGILLRA